MPKMKQFAVFSFIAFILAFSPKLYASQNSLGDIQNQIKEQNTNIEIIRQNSVKLALEIQDTENDLLLIDARIGDIEGQILELNNQISKAQDDIVKLSLAAMRMREVPPIILLLRRDITPIGAARTSMVAKILMRNTRQKMDGLKEDKAQLSNKQAELRQNKDMFKYKTLVLQKNMQALNKVMDEKNAALIALQVDYDNMKESAQKAANDSGNINSLIANLDNNRHHKKPAITNNFVMPVAGEIVINWGDTDAIGAKSKGLTIDARSGALVVSPMGGSIKFAGKFQDYGNIIIVEHTNELYSLLAGFDKISTVIGQVVVSGEPIGIMPKIAQNASGAKLYYELREHGAPVDPLNKDWIHKL